jgi:hypothetical protein
MTADGDVEAVAFSPKRNHPAPGRVSFYGFKGARGGRDVGLDCPMRIWYQANYMVYAQDSAIVHGSPHRYGVFRLFAIAGE